MESSSNNRLITAIIIIVLILGGFVAFKFGYYYYQIVSGNNTESVDFKTQMTISQAVSAVDQNEQIFDLSTSDDPALGASQDQAVLTIVEFVDFSCPYCQEVSSTVRRLAVLFGDQVRFIIRDFPVTDIHPDSQLAAEAAACAHEQGMFWQYHDKLFQNQSDFSFKALGQYALQAGLDQQMFDDCLNSARYRSEVSEDYAAGLAAGVYGTPTFFLNGRKVEGSIPEDMFELIIMAFLEQ